MLTSFLIYGVNLEGSNSSCCDPNLTQYYFDGINTRLDQTMELALC
jgi:hypothetical protein